MILGGDFEIVLSSFPIVLKAVVQKIFFFEFRSETRRDGSRDEF